VLNCWVTDTKETFRASKSFHDLGEVGQAACEPIDFVHNDDVDLAILDVVQEALESRTIESSARVSAVVISGREPLYS
jgi:hypothetical protein